MRSLTLLLRGSDDKWFTTYCRAMGLRMRVGVLKQWSHGLGRVLTLSAALTCLGAAPSNDASPSGVIKVRFGGDQHQTRVVLELDRSTRGRLLADGADSRLVLAFPGVDLASDQRGTGQGLVKSWSVERIAGSATLRLALTRGASVARRFVLAPSDGSPNYRYVLDLDSREAVPSAPVILAAAPVQPVSVSVSMPVHARKVVVIDAGHGGKDPGALGLGSQEKDITLAAARALKRRLERDGRYTVVLTRSDDEFVPLESRVRIARDADADLFISLHADAGADPALHGATIYTLSDKGSDRVARNVINKDDWFINVSMPSRDRAVNQILLDLTQRATKNQSSAFAEMLVSRVSASTVLLQHSHRDAGYVVLLAPDVPAVLLEMGFITNAHDEGVLTDAPRRARLMAVVGDSIDDYFSRQQRYASR